MKVAQIIEHIRNRYHPNVLNVKQAEDSSLIGLINEGLIALHTLFDIRVEQAVVKISGQRKNYVISKEDPAVSMASFKQLGHNQLKDNPAANSLFNLNEDKEVLVILDVEDLLGTEYLMNQVNVFNVDQTTLYFPNANDGDTIYVSYKPKPVMAKVDELNKDIDLPDSLLEVLYAFLSMRFVSSIEGFERMYPNAIAIYDKKLAEARNNQPILVGSMVDCLNKKKGFV